MGLQHIVLRIRSYYSYRLVFDQVYSIHEHIKHKHEYTHVHMARASELREQVREQVAPEQPVEREAHAAGRRELQLRLETSEPGGAAVEQRELQLERDALRTRAATARRSRRRRRRGQQSRELWQQRLAEQALSAHIWRMRVAQNSLSWSQRNQSVCTVFLVNG